MGFLFGRKLWVTILFLVVASITILSFRPVSYVSADSFNGHFFGFGDSIMRADESGMAGDGSDGFVEYMVSTYYPAYTVSHNSDGSGKTTNWPRYISFSSKVTNWGWWVIDQFGTNDIKWDILGGDYDGYTCSPNIAAQNKLDMYNWSVQNDSETHYTVCISVLQEDGVDSRPRWNQLLHYNTTMDLLKDYSVPFVPLWDAIDSEPYNGRIDNWDSSYYADNVHPNLAGHTAMGDLLYYFISGQDYTETYHSGNDTLIINADYNETIFINNTFYGWSESDVQVYCITTDTVVSHTVQSALNGSRMIRFDIEKDNVYRISDDDSYISFESIDDKGNASIITDSYKTVIWNKVNETVYYELQVANDSGFSDIWLDYDVNDSNYGINYYEFTNASGSFVSFNITVNLGYGWKYFRVRAYYYE